MLADLFVCATSSSVEGNVRVHVLVCAPLSSFMPPGPPQTGKVEDIRVRAWTEFRASLRALVSINS